MLTFEQFKNDVNAHWPNASEDGEFEEHKLSQEYGVHVYYTYTSFPYFNCSASYYYTESTLTPWYVDNGRGHGGYGDTMQAADEAECVQYVDKLMAHLLQ